MAANAAALYGRDIRCVVDADSMLSTCEGIEVVRQHAYHRLTVDNILGDDGTGSFVIAGWGFDTSRLAGMTTSRLAAQQPILSEVLQRDPRVLTADVRITPTIVNGKADVTIDASCETSLGPFTLSIKSVSDLSATDLVGQA